LKSKERLYNSKYHISAVLNNVIIFCIEVQCTFKFKYCICLYLRPKIKHDKHTILTFDFIIPVTELRNTLILKIKSATWIPQINARSDMQFRMKNIFNPKIKCLLETKFNEMWIFLCSLNFVLWIITTDILLPIWNKLRCSLTRNITFD
jgi:hypothetical protein